MLKKQTLKQSDALKRQIKALKVGDQITVTWLDPTQEDNVTLAALKALRLTEVVETGWVIRLGKEMIWYSYKKDSQGDAGGHVLPLCLITKLKVWR